MAVKKCRPDREAPSGDPPMHIVASFHRQNVQRYFVQTQLVKPRVSAEIPNVQFRNAVPGLPMSEFGQALAPIVIRIADDFVPRAPTAPEFIDITQPIGPSRQT